MHIVIYDLDGSLYNLRLDFPNLLRGLEEREKVAVTGQTEYKPNMW